MTEHRPAMQQVPNEATMPGASSFPVDVRANAPVSERTAVVSPSSMGTRDRFVTTGALLATLSACAPAPQQEAPPAVPAVVSTPCAPDGNPRTSEEVYCADRRDAPLRLVVVPDLPTPPGMDPISRDLAAQAGERAAEYLRVASNGAITLHPEVVDAPVGTADEIKKRNRGFEKGGDCVDTEDEPNLMGKVVRDLQPELLSDHAQVVVIGGQSCKVTYAKEAVAGKAHYEPRQQMADVFADAQSAPMFQINNPTVVDFVGGVIAHEVGHDFNLGHSGDMRYKDPKKIFALQDDPSRPVDLETLLSEVESFSPYGDWGRIMSNVTAGMTGNEEQDRATLIDPAQEQFIYRSSFPPNYNDREAYQRHKANEPMPNLFMDDEVTLADDPKSQKAVDLFSGKYFAFNGYEFDSLEIVPRFRENETVVELVLTTEGVGDERINATLPTASLGLFKLPQDGQAREITLPYRTVSITKEPGQNAVKIAAKSNGK